MSSRSAWHRLVLVTALILAAGPLEAAQRAVPGPSLAPVEPTFFLVIGRHLERSADAVDIVFEYRDGDRLVARDVVRLDAPPDDVRAVQLPSEGLELWRRSSLADPILRVFSGGRTLEIFDPAGLETYNLALRYRHPALVTEASDGLLVGFPEEPDGIYCESPCGGGCGSTSDYDCDGIPLAQDNCPDHYNPNQANCDGDPWGDVCDVVDGVYQDVGPVDTCMTDKDTNGLTGSRRFEHHVERRQVDVSSCNSPDRWRRWIRAEGGCQATSNDSVCCQETLGNSINAIGDSINVWCGAQRNQDFCN